ncbi:MAG: hypothetical protein U9P79_09005, partial [Candidatus Cloacimonadota bacterium]|nr:hypothetical protein [Candidatus Cloacimonadota bacterium]
MENLTEILLPYISYDETGILTSIWVAGLHVLFVMFFISLLIKFYIVKRSINRVETNFTEKAVSTNKYLKIDWLSYQQHFINLDKSKKTDDFAEQYFGIALIEKIFNTELWKSVPGMFVGFGILGTFAGLCIGLSDFNFSSSKVILSSIQILIDGIKTAFLTSLHGIFLSIIFGCFENVGFHSLENTIQKLCAFLNNKYKLTKYDKIQIAKTEREDLLQSLDKSANERQTEIQKIIINQFQLNRNEITNHLSEYLNKLFVTKDNSGNELHPANIFRDLLRETEQQSQALKSFSTDLADVIMGRLEEMSTRSILPEFKKIIDSFESLESSIKSFSLTAGQDMGNELKNIVSSLQKNLEQIVEDFREAFSSGAMQQLNRVVEALNESAKVMEALPSLLEKMLADINQTSNEDSTRRRKEASAEFDNVKNNFRTAVDAIVKNLNQMEIIRVERENERQEQASGELEDTIKKFQSSIDSIIGNLSRAEQKQIDREQELLNQVNGNLSDSVKQIEDMILVQESYTKQITDLLSSTRDVVKDEKELLTQINENNNLMVNISHTFGAISSDLKNNTGNIESSINYLNSSLQTLKEQFGR